MKISLRTLSEIGAIAALAIGMYYQMQYIERDNAELHKQLEAVQKDQKWTERNLMKFEYGNIE